MVTPARRSAFEEGRRVLGDARDLSIAEYHLEEIRLSPDGRSARVVSQVSWHRLPSLSQREDTVVTDLEWSDGVWLIAGQSGGPFAEDFSRAAN